MNWLEYAVHEFEGNAWRGAAKRDEGGSIGSIGSPLSGTFENFSGSPIASKAHSPENRKTPPKLLQKETKQIQRLFWQCRFPHLRKIQGGHWVKRGFPTSLLAVSLPASRRIQKGPSQLSRSPRGVDHPKFFKMTLHPLPKETLETLRPPDLKRHHSIRRQ